MMDNFVPSSPEDNYDDWVVLEVSEVNLSTTTTTTKKNDTRDNLIRGSDHVITVGNYGNVVAEISNVKDEVQDAELVNPHLPDIRPPDPKERCYGRHGSLSIDSEGLIPSSRSLLRDRTRSCATAAENIFMQQFEDDEDAQLRLFSPTLCTESNVDEPRADEKRDFIPSAWIIAPISFGLRKVKDCCDDCRAVVFYMGICCWDFISHTWQQTDAVSKWFLLVSAASVTIWAAAWISYYPRQTNTCSVLNIVVKGGRIMQLLLFGVGPVLIIIEALLSLRWFGAAPLRQRWGRTKQESNSDENNDDDGKQNQPETSSTAQKTDITMFINFFFNSRKINESTASIQDGEDGIHMKNSSELVVRVGSVTLLCISVGAITQSVILYCS